MKRILHLTHTDIRSDSRILKEMRAAESSGYTVYGIGIELSEGAKNVDDGNLCIKTLKIKSRSFTFLPKVARHALTFLEFFFKAFLHSLSLRPALIHANDTLVLPIAALIKVCSRARLIYDAHELESNRNGLSKTLGAFIKVVERIFWPFVDGLIVVSPSIKNWYLTHIGEKKSEIVLNSPFFENTGSGAKLYLRSSFNIPDSAMVFIYIGILGQGRGIDLILDAFRGSEKAHVIFLGYGDYWERLEGIAKSEPNIHLHKAVEHNKVVEIASSADVGLCLVQNVSLSDYFCLPNKLFEYAFAGLPVLASNFPDIRKVVEDYSLGRCVDLMPESIREGIQWFVDDHGNVKKPDADIKALSWQEQERKLVEFYKVISR